MSRMDAVDVDSVLWRFITLNDFKSMNGLHATEQGGSAKHIVLSSRDAVGDFFNVTAQPRDRVIRTTIDVVPVSGIPDSGESIALACQLDRRNGEWRLPDQDQNRYELWTPQHGFPAPSEISWREQEDYYDEAPPIIYFIRDREGRYHARAVPDTTDDTLQNYPATLAHPWQDSREKRNRGNFGIETFAADAEMSI